MGWRQAGKKRFVTTTSQGRDGRREGKALAVNVSDLEKKFEAGAEITVESLAKAGFSDNPKIKILGNGERGSRRSSPSRSPARPGSAKAKIEKAGGRLRRLSQRGRTKNDSVGRFYWHDNRTDKSRTVSNWRLFSSRQQAYYNKKRGPLRQHKPSAYADGE